MLITKSWLRDQHACKESYRWLKKQKDKSTTFIANKLFKEEKFDWCLWLLYRKTIIAKVYVWSLLLFSILLSVLSFYSTSLGLENVAIATAVAAVAAGIAAVAAVAAVAASVAGVAIATAVAAVAVAAVATAVAAVAASVAGVAAVAGAGVWIIIICHDILIKFVCKISIKGAGR